MGDYRVLRIGGIVAMVGAVLALVFNLLHPRTTKTGIEAHLELVSGSSIWLLDHFVLLLVSALLIFPAWAIARSFRTEPSRSWAGASLAFAIAGALSIFLTVLVDGAATQEVADDWARSRSEASFGTASAVVEVGLALFTGMIALQFGFVPVVFGITILNGVEYPRGLGWLALVAGIAGLVTATLQYFGGLTNLSSNVLFPISSVLFTVWLFVMGWRLYNRTSTAELMEPVDAAVPA